MMGAIREKASTTVEALVQRMGLPFSLAIMAYLIPIKFRISPMEAFDRNQDPFDHLKVYKTLMHLHDVLDGIMCKMFLMIYA